jgi:predicted dehydrogenase
MLALGDESLDRGLKVGVGLMCRHCVSRQELYDRIKMGQLGDVIALRAYRVHGPVAECFVPPNPGKLPEVLYQIQKFHSFLWASGGLFSDFYIHNIDECCWMKDAWPIKAEAMGGRHYRGDMVDQNFDTYDVEYTFPDGAKLFMQGRCIDGCANQFASYAHGSKGIAQISINGHSPAKCRIWRGQNAEGTPDLGLPPARAQPVPDRVGPPDGRDPQEQAVQRRSAAAAEASLITSMGRMAAHTGPGHHPRPDAQLRTRVRPQRRQAHNGRPRPPDATSDGKYPIPQPGIKKTREY